ncbi:hypothetical protein REPUB_Repub05bG0042100 [Reevesia pubescens]
MAAAKTLLSAVVRCLKMLASYLLCLIYFSNIKELRQQKELLKLAIDQLDEDVKDAKDREIKEDVKRWLTDAKQALEAVRILEHKIEDKKWRLTSRLNLSQRYCLSKEIEDQKQKILQLVRASSYDQVVFRVDNFLENGIFSSRDFMPSGSFKSALRGIVIAMKDERESVIFVFGPRGVGKTTLAELAGKKAEELLHFKVVRLVVSHSTTTEKVQDTLAAFLGLNFYKKTVEGRAEQLRLRLKTEQRILIILDDFSKELNLESIGIPYHVGCKILLTTSDWQAIRSSKVIQLGSLKRMEAINLLKKNLSLDITSDEIKQVAEQVAHVCKHSPIALIILGRALRGKFSDEWTKAYQSLQRKLVEGERKEVKIVFRSIKLSYDNLKYNETRVCFLLCSLFRKDYPIARRDLIRFAWGLGIYQGFDSIEKVRDKVHGAIDDLVESFLLLENGKHVQMQNVVHEAALWIASKDESFPRIKSVVGLWERPKNEELEYCTAISYVASKLEELHDEEFRSEKLQILFLGGDGCKTISDQHLQCLDALKVLAIRHGLLSLNALQNLTNLRALHLEYCKFNGLSSVGKLKKLEILSFQGSDINELPEEIGELDNLRLLDLFDCKLKSIPLNLIWRLSRLEELYFSGLSFEKWWSHEKSAEGSNTTPIKIISPSSLETGSFKHKKNSDEWFETTSRALKVYVFLQNQSKEWDQTVKYLDRDHLLCYENHVVPNLVQSAKMVRVKSCDKLQAIFQDGSILHADKEEGSVALLSELTSLELEDLPQLSWIWYGKTYHVTLQNLNTVKLKDCHILQYLFSVSLAQSLKQLETLEIHGCNKLKQIIAETRDDLDVDVDVEVDIHPGVLDPRCLPRLTTLRITGCRALEYVFQITTGQILPKLTLLDISSCPHLKQVFSYKDEVDEKDIEVPQLEKLALKNLMSLKTFCSENRSIKLPSLQHLEVGACHKLSNAAMFEVIRHGKLMEFCLFKVGNRLCGNIFEFQGGRFLSHLKELKLKDLNEPDVIWKQPTQIVTLQNLTRLEVVKCNKLRKVFSLLLARNLLQLSNLVVQGCEELEEIVARDQISSSTSRLQPVYFPNLMEILIEDCNKLKSLFPVSVARLPKLRTFRVRRDSKLMEIFRHENEAEVKSEKEVVLRFSKLEILQLENLPSLVSLIPVGYFCILPNLKSLVKKDCRSIVTSFFQDDSETTVYAKTEKTSISERHQSNSELRRSLTLKEILDHNKDIDWSPGMKID